MKVKAVVNKMVVSRVKLIKSVFSEKNIPRLIIMLFLLAILYFVYDKYLKEGFEVESKELEDEVKSGTKLVLFYADWCGHCKKIKPVWDEASKEVNKSENQMIKVNCGEGTEKDKEIMKKYNIEGYPTIIVFKNGSPSVYNGERDVNSFKGVFNL